MTDTADTPPVTSDTSDTSNATIDLLDALTDTSATSVASSEKEPSQAERLVKLAREHCSKLAHTDRGEPYATVPFAGTRQTIPINGSQFESWLTTLAYHRWGKPPSPTAMRTAISTLAAIARIDGDEIEVRVRTAADGFGGVLLNLADSAGHVAHVHRTGWTVHTDAASLFRTIEGQQPLPVPSIPSCGNAAEQLRSFVNVEDDDAMVLLTCVLVAYMWPTGPYPILCIQGVQGSAKSTTTRIIRKLVDPHVVELRRLPGDVRDFMIAAEHNHVLAFDNLSGMRQDVSDVICTLATGAGFATRTLYANASETLFAACRPIILNGIDAGATRGDLLDRAVMLHLPAIPATQRRTEAELWAAFDAAHPSILGTLLDVLVDTIRALPSVELDEMPRMADFARLAVAAEAPLGWPPGSFMRVYTGNREAAITRTLEADTLATTLRILVLERGPMEMTPSELLHAMNNTCPACSADRTWPRSADALGKRVNRIIPLLNEARWMRIERSRGDQRHIIIEPHPEQSDGSDDGGARALIEQHFGPVTTITPQESDR